jgi:hypothetical protein
MATAGMISRHFEDSRGNTATLEFPAGWSSLKFYRLTVRGPDGALAIPTETKTYDSADEARAAAVRREREALASGWRPKMAAVNHSDRPTMTLYREDGRPLGCRVIGWTRSDRADVDPIRGRAQLAIRSIEYRYEIDAEGTPGGTTPNAGDNLIVVIGHGEEQTYFKLMVQHAEYEERGWGANPRLVINGAVVPSDTTNLPALVANAVMRETLIANYDTVEHLPSYSILWSELSTAVPDHAARAVLVQEIINRRSERDAAMQRFRDILARAEQTALRVERLPARRATRTSPAAQEPPPQPTVDLGKPKQRKIKLGD